MAETSVYVEPAGTKTTMNAARVVSPGRVEIEQVKVPQPGQRQILVRLEGCGVCASNIPPFEGREWFTYPMEPGALGHEGWGIVEGLGKDVSGFSIGDRVAALSQHAYAEYDVVNCDSLVKVPSSLDTRPLPGEPLGCTVNIFKRSSIRPGDTVVIVGIGFLGALLTQLAANHGARVIAIARRPYAQKVAEDMGAHHVLPMNDHWQIIEQVKSLTNGTFADVVIECVGKQWPLDLAAELCRERGRLVVAGYHQDGLRQVNMQLWNWRGLDVINAHEREHQVYIDGISEAIRKVEDATLRPEPLYTHRFHLDNLGTALELTRDRPEGFMKALISLDRHE